jgi:RimJ/RimL family protein N-acetyltransferase
VTAGPPVPLPAAPPVRFDAVTTRLRDGTPALIRPIVPADKDLLRRGLRELSEESRVRRFMRPVSELTDEQLAYFTEVDGWDHFAWVAVRADAPDEGLGVARYVRIPEEPTVAEAAVTVADAHQGQGLGTLLLSMLALAARAAGIERFRAYVMAENRPIREIAEEFGAEARFDSPGVLRIEVPLEPAEVPGSAARRALRAIARRLRVPLGGAQESS